jgi:hypothetical protein
VVQELEQEEEGAEAKKARLRAKRTAKKSEKKQSKRKDVRCSQQAHLDELRGSPCLKQPITRCFTRAV